MIGDSQIDDDYRRLFSTAVSRISEALGAWLEEDYDRAAASAPIGVELLIKALLWSRNPVLLLPLESNQEKSLIALASHPSLQSPSLRTVGLRPALSRLEALCGELPVPSKRRQRLIDLRNGAIHVGAMPAEGAMSAELLSRQALTDALMLCDFVLGQLGANSSDLYGGKAALVEGLLQDHRGEVQHRVDRRLARASSRIDEWRAGFEDDGLYEIAAAGVAEGAAEAFPAHLYGSEVEMAGVAQSCPVCGFDGRLLGRLDVDAEGESEYADGGYYTYTVWRLFFYARAFGCSVCKLELKGQEELQFAAIPASVREVSEEDVAPDFVLTEYVEWAYGLPD